MSLQSAVYVINHSTLVANKRSMPQHTCELLPNRLSVNDLARLLVTMQKICFHDENIGDENLQRIIDVLSTKHDKTLAIVLSLADFEDEADYQTFRDGGSATIQLSNQGFLKYQQPFVNEVCRSKLTDRTSALSPVAAIMNMIDLYVQTTIMKTRKTVDGVYLYIEKAPEHGSPNFLLKYYAKYGYSVLPHQDDEFYYMCKPFHGIRSPNQNTRKKSNPASPKGKVKTPSP
jgi:hypothetical protein